MSGAGSSVVSPEQFPAIPQVPQIEYFPVDGNVGAVTVHGGGLMNTSHLLDGQGQRITAMSDALAPKWSGEAATSYHSLAGDMAHAFTSAARAIEGAASLMLRYATKLEGLKREAATAERESEHWHGEIVTWTGRAKDAQTELTRAQHELRSAEGDQARAVAHGAAGVGAASAAGAAIGRARGDVGRAQTDLNQARRQLRDAHDQFTHWQDRGRRIYEEAKTAGEELNIALLGVTIVRPPLPGAPDYPPLEPTPRILVNDDTGDDETGGKGGQGDDKDGQGDEGKDEKGGKGEGESTDRKPEQDKQLTPGDIKKLKDAGLDPHDLKDGSGSDLYKDRQGNIYEKPKGGSGPGEPLGINMNDL